MVAKPSGPPPGEVRDPAASPVSPADARPTDLRLPGCDARGGTGRHERYTSTTVAMDTIVTLHVETDAAARIAQTALRRAQQWFLAVERTCSRFDPSSELADLARQPGRAVPVSPLLFEAVAFACAVARRTRGAFDPTIGRQQQARGFNSNYITGAAGPRGVQPAGAGRADYRDVVLDPAARTITLRKPLLLDLGAVAKGLAIDLAARELRAFTRFAVEAGGDLFAGGAAATAAPWQIGIRAPGDEHELLDIVPVLNAAVCTSAGNERPATEAGEHHLLDPHSGRSPRGALSVTVIAPTALVADALATAAFVLGPARGSRLLDRQRLSYLILTAAGERITPNTLRPWFAQ